MRTPFPATIIAILQTLDISHSFAQTPPSPDQVTLVDAEDLLAERFKIDRRPIPKQNSDCDGGGSGMRAQKYCNWYAEFRDIRVEKILSYKVGAFETSSVPAIYERQKIGIRNKFSAPFEFSETAEYQSKQYAQVSLTQRLTNVKEFKTGIEVNGTLFKSVGIRETDESKSLIEVELTKQETMSHDEMFTITHPIKFPVPPCTARFAEISDQKHRVNLPIEIHGVLVGRVVYNVRGWGREIPVRDIGSGDPLAQREFVVKGFVNLQGSDRSLDISLVEEKIPESECAKK